MGAVLPQRFAQSLLSSRRLADGGFVDRPGGIFNVPAGAWSILALRAAGEPYEDLERLRRRLTVEQEVDGRLSIDRAHRDVCWPTALSILAWDRSSSCRAAQEHGARFLLETTGVHPEKKAGDPTTHNTALQGWPWVIGTYSWIEPTALSILALHAAGYRQHPRVQEAVSLLVDRQLPHGGWNYGNTLLFGRELHPMPETTGAALTALAGLVSPDRFARSVDYLQGEIGRLRTPVSLGWSLLGLAAWNRWPAKGLELIDRCLANQTRYGVYDTWGLAVLCLAAHEGELNPEHAFLTRLSR